MDPGLQLTSVSPHDIFALAATAVSVCAVKSFMKLCLLEQPQHYSYKVCGLLSTSEAHTITTQNTPG